jgi:hypothetical protein
VASATWQKVAARLLCATATSVQSKLISLSPCLCCSPAGAC